MATVDFAAVRSMDDFLINPTTSALDDRVRQSEMSDHEQYMSGTPANVFVLKRNHGKSVQLVRDVEDELPEDPAYWRSYDSDEEMASPIADDDMSFHSSRSSSLVNYSDVSLPEQLVNSCEQVPRQCSKAQAVVLRPVGKPRVVSVSSPTSPRFPKFPQPTEVQRRPVPQRDASAVMGSETTSDDERNSSIGSDSGRKSPASTAASSISEQAPPLQPRSIRRKPSQDELATAERVAVTISSRRGSTPLNFMVPRSKTVMETVPEPMSATVPRTSEPQRRDASFDSISSTAESSLATAIAVAVPTTTKRRMQKISSTLNLQRFGSRSRASRSDSTRSSSAASSEFEQVKEPEPIILSPPPRSSARPKLVPRGANERAPPIRLPPCPPSSNVPVLRATEVDDDRHHVYHEQATEQYSDEIDEEEVAERHDNVWPLRAESVKRSSYGFNIAERWQAAAAASHTRRRSLSTDVSAWQS